MDKLLTTLHYYYLDISKEADAARYADIVASCEDAGVECFTSRAPWMSEPSYDKVFKPYWNAMKALNGATIELEAAHLFENQWNSAPNAYSDNGFRLFDWKECIFDNASIKQGYWLDITPTLREARRNRYACGYCGKQEPAQKGYVFCPHCIDSETLKETELHLTRMQSVASRADRAPLTDAERAHLLPLYRQAQKEGATKRGIARTAKQRESIEREYQKTVSNAAEKRDAARWIMDNAPQFLDNWIYYSHTDRHCFGWRTALREDEVSALLDVVSEFPFLYELKCADGRNLSN